MVLLACLLTAALLPAPRLAPTTRPTRAASARFINMQAGASAMADGARVGPPPDLPSLLLHNRIIYIGMPLVPSVTARDRRTSLTPPLNHYPPRAHPQRHRTRMPTPQELIVAELLYLNYESKDKSVYMYINSMGTSVGQGQTTAFETEAFAIADTMSYVGPDIETICIGVAYGTVGTPHPPSRAHARYPPLTSTTRAGGDAAGQRQEGHTRMPPQRVSHAAPAARDGAGPGLRPSDQGA